MNSAIYNTYSGSFDNKNYRPINGLEWFVMFFSVITLCGIVGFGFLYQNNYNRDRQRQSDILNQIVPALENFYQNSSMIESGRFYPKSVCSRDLNEVDYELTLRQHLDGSLPEIENHTYIPTNSWPKDRSGVYSNTFPKRQIPYRCPNILNFDTLQENAEIYKDFPSCNFNLAKNLKQCYLYTSTSSGDEFRIGYFSQSSGCFEIFRKFRNQKMENERQC